MQPSYNNLSLLENIAMVYKLNFLYFITLSLSLIIIIIIQIRSKLSIPKGGKDIFFKKKQVKMFLVSKDDFMLGQFMDNVL